MKKIPRLHLVTNGAASAAGETAPVQAELQFVSLGELGSAERTRVERLLAEVCPNAGVLAIALSDRVWDVRPIVAIGGEGGPSIIRLLGPEVTLDVQISEHVNDVLVQLKKYSDLSSKLIAWGTFEGQLWYRRSFIDRTLADVLIDDLPQSRDIVQLFGIGFNLIDEVANWHSRGVIHGHITPSNIHIGPDGALDLLDAAIGSAIVQATKKLGIEEFPAGYQKDTFAVELLSGAGGNAAVDIFGLGTVLRRILSRIRQLQDDSGEQQFSSQDLRSLTDLTGAMIVKDAARRPALGKVKRAFGEKGRVLYGGPGPKGPKIESEKSNATAPAAPPGPATPQGTPANSQGFNSQGSIITRQSTAERGRPVLSSSPKAPPSGRVVSPEIVESNRLREPKQPVDRSGADRRSERNDNLDRQENRDRPENRDRQDTRDRNGDRRAGDRRNDDRARGDNENRDRKDTTLTARRPDLRNGDPSPGERPERGKQNRDDRNRDELQRSDRTREDRSRDDRSREDRSSEERSREARNRDRDARNRIDRPESSRREERQGSERRVGPENQDNAAAAQVTAEITSPPAPVAAEPPISDSISAPTSEQKRPEPKPAQPKPPTGAAATGRVRLGQVAPSPNRTRTAEQPKDEPVSQPADNSGSKGADSISREQRAGAGERSSKNRDSLHSSDSMPHILGNQFGTSEGRTPGPSRSSGSFIGFGEPEDHSPIGGIGINPPADPFSTGRSADSDFRSAYDSYEYTGTGQLQKPVKNGTWLGRIIFGTMILAAFGFVVMTIHPWEHAAPRIDPAQTGQMEISWSSRTPSGMMPVVLAAIDRERPNQMAEMLILKSVMSGEQNLPGVNSKLLRIAFDPRWEASLSPEDRRTALAGASAVLLGDKMPKDLKFENLHPGVLLSFAATFEPGNPILSRISAESLAALPLPFGPAFQELIPEGQAAKLTAQDDSIRMLARFGTRGIEDSQNLSAFLPVDGDRRLRALAQVYSQDNVAARQALDILINHPNIKIQNDYIQWGKKWNILGWSELDNSDQLFVLAGMRPSKIPAAPNLAALFTHPGKNLRAYAISSAIDNFKFDHPGAVEVLTQLRNNPDLITPKQTGDLALFLESPDGVSKKQVMTWLAGDPSVDLVSRLLLSTADAPKAEPMDPYLTRYLVDKNWSPDLGQLRKLAKHPDRYTRLHAYSKVFELSDHQLALGILNEAKKNEKDPQWIIRLDEMIGVLTDGSVDLK